jgi:hypothetical protein
MRQHDHYCGWRIEYQSTDEMWVTRCYIESEVPRINDLMLTIERHYVGRFKYPEIAHEEAKKLIDWRDKETTAINDRVAQAFREGLIALPAISEDKETDEED